MTGRLTGNFPGDLPRATRSGVLDSIRPRRGCWSGTLGAPSGRAGPAPAHQEDVAAIKRRHLRRSRRRTRAPLGSPALTLRRACRPDGERPALRGKQGATRRFRPIAGSPWFGRGAPAADDEEARGRGVSSWRVCRRRACRTSCGPRGDAGNNPCSRQGDQVVAPGSTGRGLLVEDDHGTSAGTPISRSPTAWRRPSAARRPLTGHACPDGRPGGGWVRSATLRTTKRHSTLGAGVRPLSPAVAVVGTRPDGALACRPQQARPRPVLGRSHVG
jgi:hypothetical protein